MDLIICARGNSKGIPNKNSRLFGNSTLVERAIHSAKKANLTEKIFVSSEDEKILDLAKNAGADYVYERNKLLSEDNVRQVEVVYDLIEFYRSKKIIFTPYVVLLQTTTPFINSDDIDNAIKKHINLGYSQIVSGYKVNINPCEFYIANNDKTIRRIYANEVTSQRQLQNDLYRINGGVRIFNIDKFLNSKKFFQNNLKLYIYEMSKENSLNLDSLSDWRIGLDKLKDSR